MYKKESVEAKQGKGSKEKRADPLKLSSFILKFSRWMNAILFFIFLILLKGT